MEELEQGDQGLLGMIHPQERPGQARHVPGHQEGAGAAGRGLREVLPVGDEGDVRGPALSSGATPVTTRVASPTSDAPSASASRPSVNEAPSLTYLGAFRV